MTETPESGEVQGEAPQQAAFDPTQELENQPTISAPAPGGGEAQQSSVMESTELHEPADKAQTSPLDLDFILDIPLTVNVEVGRTKLLIRDLLQLGQGSVIELDKLMGDPFEVMVNDKLVARGEIVVVNDRFGVRLTDIISETERVRTLA